jgi:hypothetical protein
MAATQGMCDSFKLELPSCYHCFTAPTLTSGTRAADTFKIALYTSTSTNNFATATYTTTNEITNTSGTAYTAGGQTLAGVALGTNSPVSAGASAATVWIDWTTDPSWTTATFTANSALIYNSTQLSGANGRAVCVLAFGSDKTVTAGTFTIQFPTADATNALIRFA